MPVLISPEDFARWLDPAIPGVELADLLCPSPAEAMQAWPVSRAVSNSRSEGAELTAPAGFEDARGGYEDRS